MIRFCYAASLAVAASALMPVTASIAQEWPTEPVHLIVGYPPGSSPDIMARLLMEPLTGILGQPVIIENTPGAGGAIGVQQVLRSDPEYTFGITTNGPLTTAFRLTPGITYDVESDIAPVSLVGTSPMILILNNDAEPETLEDFIEWARGAPGEVSYGSIGEGTGSHLATELFATTAEIDLWHVPYASFPEVTNAVLRGEIDAAFMAPSGALEQYRAGSLKVLGISSSEPSEVAPDVATLASSPGMPDDFRADIWIAAIASVDTPPDILERLNAAITEALETEEVQQRMLGIGWEAEGGPAERLAERIVQDTQVWGEVIDNAGLGIE